MKVLINAASAKMGGAVTYLKNLLLWLPRVAPQHRFTVYAPGGTLEEKNQYIRITDFNMYGASYID